MGGQLTLVQENHNSVPASEIQCQKLLIETTCLRAPNSSLLTGVTIK